MSFPQFLLASLPRSISPIPWTPLVAYDMLVACLRSRGAYCLVLLARRFLVPDLPVTRSRRCIPEPVTCLVRVIWSRLCKRTDRRADKADDASCAFELGRNAVAYTCMHASVRVQAIAGIEIAGLLGTWRCPFLLCAYRASTTAFMFYLKF